MPLEQKSCGKSECRPGSVRLPSWMACPGSEHLRLSGSSGHRQTHGFGGQAPAVDTIAISESGLATENEQEGTENTPSWKWLHNTDQGPVCTKWVVVQRNKCHQDMLAATQCEISAQWGDVTNGMP